MENVHPKQKLTSVVNHFVGEQLKYLFITVHLFAECGRWNLKEDPGTLLGNTSYEWPSLALLFNVRQKTTCTLTIFSPVWLIASYNCVSQISLDPKEWVVFGGTPGSSPLGQGATQIKMVKNLVGHPLARQGPHFMDKDYLLVELLQPLKLDSQVQASCLASDSISPTQTCLTAGWVRSQTEGNKCRLYYNQT
jgi:hypothetical protein